MNNIDLTQILKDCPKGTRFWTSTYGEVLFSSIEINSNFPLKFYVEEYNGYIFLTKHGYHDKSEKGEYIVFPSKDQRNWNVWKEEQDKKKLNSFNVGDYCINNYGIISHITNIHNDRIIMKSITLGYEAYAHDTEVIKIDKYPIDRFKPFDKVLVRYGDARFWKIEFFNSYRSDYTYKFCGISNNYQQCIPYNEETKHLIGTLEKAPEFYINW